MIRQLLAICLLGLTFIGNLQAVESLPGSRDVEVKMVLLDVNEVDSVRQSFIANLVVVMRWHDPSLAHEESDPISCAENQHCQITLMMRNTSNERPQFVYQTSAPRTYPAIWTNRRRGSPGF